MSEWKVSKSGDPRCKYPWEVDGPDGELSDVFATWAEAIRHTAVRIREGGKP